MKSKIVTSVNYESPDICALGIDTQYVLCVSTEGFIVNPGKIDEDDWE